MDTSTRSDNTLWQDLTEEPNSNKSTGTMELAKTLETTEVTALMWTANTTLITDILSSGLAMKAQTKVGGSTPRMFTMLSIHSKKLSNSKSELKAVATELFSTMSISEVTNTD